MTLIFKHSFLQHPNRLEISKWGTFFLSPGFLRCLHFQFSHSFLASLSLFMVTRYLHSLSNLWRIQAQVQLHSGLLKRFWRMKTRQISQRRLYSHFYWWHLHVNCSAVLWLSTRQPHNLHRWWKSHSAIACHCKLNIHPEALFDRSPLIKRWNTLSIFQ